MRILITGFEPFGNDTENASGEIVRQVGPDWQAITRFSTAVLPVEFDTLEAALEKAIAKTQPDLILGLGEAGGRTHITPERYAHNRIDARIPDNAGAQPHGVIVPGGPQRLETRIPVDSIAEVCTKTPYPTTVSQDAGGFVCNYLAYLLYKRPEPNLFVHVPALRSGGALATVGSETDAGAVTAASDYDFFQLAECIRLIGYLCVRWAPRQR